MATQGPAQAKLRRLGTGRQTGRKAGLGRRARTLGRVPGGRVSSFGLCAAGLEVRRPGGRSRRRMPPEGQGRGRDGRDGARDWQWADEGESMAR